MGTKKIFILFAVVFLMSCSESIKSNYWVVRVISYPAYDSFLYYDGSVDKYSGRNDIRINNVGSGYTSSEITSLEQQSQKWIDQCLKFREGKEPVYLITPCENKTRIK